MIHRIITIMIAGVLLSGCTAAYVDDGLVKEALLERETASIRLAKAITRYCAASTDTLESRHNCIVEQRLLSVQREQVDLALKTPGHSIGLKESLTPPALRP
ncbi:MAG: hypothetical protein NW701_00430 [Nitrospira sp.]